MHMACPTFHLQTVWEPKGATAEVYSFVGRFLVLDEAKPQLHVLEAANKSVRIMFLVCFVTYSLSCLNNLCTEMLHMHRSFLPGASEAARRRHHRVWSTLKQWKSATKGMEYS